MEVPWLFCLLEGVYETFWFYSPLFIVYNEWLYNMNSKKAIKQIIKNLNGNLL